MNDQYDKERCHADRDGDCSHRNCPQIRDGEPETTGRHWGIMHLTNPREV